MLRWIVFVSLLAIGCQSNSSADQTPSTMPEPTRIDWQGHRGARGLFPENSLHGFLEAVEFPEIQTMELDVVVSRDSQVVVSHEPWFSEVICKDPAGNALEEDPERYNLYAMDYATIRQYDCGSRPHPDFPDQKKRPTYKPLLIDVFKAVEVYCEKINRPAPNYNIELKSRPEWDDHYTPPPATFVRLVREVMARQESAPIYRTCIQSFDPRILREFRTQDSSFTLALLVANPKGVAKNIETLGFVPDIYSPNYRLLSSGVIDTIHEMGMKVIPWTVNDPRKMESLLKMGVDGIITDYPDRIPNH